jgi:acyl-CoA thioester hydrolase
MTSAIHHRIRVRYSESDQMGIAHHGSYVTWLEECRIEFLRVRGASYRELEAQGIGMPVVDLALRYKRSVRFDDVLDCRTTVAITGPSRLVFTTEITLDGKLCAEGVVTLATVDKQGRPMRLPVEIVERLMQGADMTASPAP